MSVQVDHEAGFRLEIDPAEQLGCRICGSLASVEREFAERFCGEIERCFGPLCEVCDDREPTYAEAVRAQIRAEEGGAL